jgi:hypothetical protein
LVWAAFWAIFFTILSGHPDMHLNDLNDSGTKKVSGVMPGHGTEDSHLEAKQGFLDFRLNGKVLLKMTE